MSIIVKKKKEKKKMVEKTIKFNNDNYNNQDSNLFSYTFTIKN